MRPFIGVITLLISSRGPHCIHDSHQGAKFGRLRLLGTRCNTYNTSLAPVIGVYHVLQTLGFQTPCDNWIPKNLPKRSNLSRYDWKTRDMQLWKWEKLKNEKKTSASPSSLPRLSQDHLMRWSLGPILNPSQNIWKTWVQKIQ